MAGQSRSIDQFRRIGIEHPVGVGIVQADRRRATAVPRATPVQRTYRRRSPAAPSNSRCAQARPTLATIGDQASGSVAARKDSSRHLQPCGVRTRATRALTESDSWKSPTRSGFTSEIRRFTTRAAAPRHTAAARQRLEKRAAGIESSSGPAMANSPATPRSGDRSRTSRRNVFSVERTAQRQQAATCASVTASAKSATRLRRRAVFVLPSLMPAAAIAGLPRRRPRGASYCTCFHTSFTRWFALA